MVKSTHTTAKNSLKAPCFCSLTLPFMAVSDPCSWVTAQWHENNENNNFVKEVCEEAHISRNGRRCEKKGRFEYKKLVGRRKWTLFVLSNKRKNVKILTHSKWYDLKRTSSAKSIWWRIQYTTTQIPTCHKEKRSMKRICVSKRRSKNTKNSRFKKWAYGLWSQRSTSETIKRSESGKVCRFKKLTGNGGT